MTTITTISYNSPETCLSLFVLFPILSFLTCVISLPVFCLACCLPCSAQHINVLLLCPHNLSFIHISQSLHLHPIHSGLFPILISVPYPNPTTRVSLSQSSVPYFSLLNYGLSLLSTICTPLFVIASGMLQSISCSRLPTVLHLLFDQTHLFL